MITPTTYMGALLLAILTMICWGSWANTMKMAGNKWRFELYYLDYTVGLLLFAIFAAFTFGMFGTDINFVDNVTIVRKRQLGLGVAAGGVFNLANMLLVAAISIAGMAVAFPIGVGLALIIGVIWSYLLKPQGNPALLFGGAAVVLGAIVVAAIAHRILNDAKVVPPIVDKSGRQRPGPKPSAAKGILLSLISGVLMGSFYPMIQMARRDDIEMGPYALALTFAIGVVATTPLYSLYFLMLPVQGNAVKITKYFEGSARQHLLGLAGGAIWCAGLVANLAAAATPPDVKVGPAVSYALGQGAALVSTMWGLFVWKEFAGAPSKSRMYIHAALGLYVAGLALISIAPLFSN